LVAALTAVLSVVGFAFPRRIQPLWVAVLLLTVLVVLFARAAYKIRVASVTPFPDVEIHAESLRAMVRHDRPNAHLVHVRARITNREPTRGVSLTFELFIDPVKTPGKSYPAFRNHHEGLQSPIDLDPMKSIVGDLAFSWFKDWDKHLSGTSPIDTGSGDKLRLEVTDHVTGKAIDMAAMGVYPTTEVTL
jgi:hypothetical protein